MWAGATRSGHHRRLVKDEAGYVALGRRFREAYRTPPAEQVRLDRAAAGPGSEWTLYDLTLLRPPGYPAALAAMLAPGRTVPGAMLVQAILGAAVVPAAHATALAMGASSSGALAAGTLAAVEPMAVGLSVRPMSESITTHLLSSGVLVWTRGLVEWNLRRLTGSGLLIGLATLTRPTTLYFAPLAALTTFAAGRLGGESTRTSTRGAALVAGAQAVVPLAWVIRNLAVTGLPILSTIEGLNALEFRAAMAVSIAEGITIEEARERLAVEFLRTDPPREPARRSRAQLVFALGVMRRHPTALLRSAVQGAKIFVFSPGHPYGIEVFGADGYRLDHPASRLVARCSALHLAVLYVGAARGALVLLGSGRARAMLPLASLLGYTLVVTAGGDTVSRFRAPLSPALAALSAIGLTGRRRTERGVRATSRCAGTTAAERAPWTHG